MDFHFHTLCLGVVLAAALIDEMTSLTTKCASVHFGFTTCLATAAKAAVTLGMVHRVIGNIDVTTGTITWTCLATAVVGRGCGTETARGMHRSKR